MNRQKQHLNKMSIFSQRAYKTVALLDFPGKLKAIPLEVFNGEIVSYFSVSDISALLCTCKGFKQPVMEYIGLLLGPSDQTKSAQINLGPVSFSSYIMSIVIALRDCKDTPFSIKVSLNIFLTWDNNPTCVVKNLDLLELVLRQRQSKHAQGFLPVINKIIEAFGLQEDPSKPPFTNVLMGHFLTLHPNDDLLQSSLSTNWKDGETFIFNHDNKTYKVQRNTIHTFDEFRIIDPNGDCCISVINVSGIIFCFRGNVQFHENETIKSAEFLTVTRPDGTTKECTDVKWYENGKTKSEESRTATLPDGRIEEFKGNVHFYANGNIRSAESWITTDSDGQIDKYTGTVQFYKNGNIKSAESWTITIPFVLKEECVNVYFDENGSALYSGIAVVLG